MKNKIRQVIPFDFNWEYGVELNRLTEDLKNLKELGATHIEIESDEYYGMACTTIEAYCYREETNEEVNQREIDKKNSIVNIEKSEREILERLKLKYENE